MSDGWDCRQLHHHDSRAEADECDAAHEPVLSEEEHHAAVAEARRRLEEARRK